MFIFIQQVEAEPDQAALIDESGSWESGLFRAAVSTPDELRDLVTRALHDYALAHASTPLDPSALARRAQDLLPESGHGRSTGVALHLAIAAGPEATVLRPAELEAPALGEEMERRALFGNTALFDRRGGTGSRLRSGPLMGFQGSSSDHSEEGRVGTRCVVTF